MRRAPRLYAALVAVAAFCLGLWALRERRVPLALLEARAGTQVERSGGGGGDPWKDARLGDELAEGDRLRTGHGCSALVSTQSGASLRIAEASTVRFTRSPERSADALALAVETGLATLRAGVRPARLHTDVGLAVLDPGSEVTIGPALGGLSIDVSIGSVRFSDAGGKLHELRAGEHVDVGIGMAVLDGKRSVEERVHVVVHGAAVMAHQGDGTSRALEPGEHDLPRGAAVRLEGDARMRVISPSGEVALDAPGSYRLGARGSHVEAVIGRARIRAKDHDVRVAMPSGTIVARAVQGGSEAELVVTTGSFEVYVLHGEVHAELDDERVVLKEGERLRRPDPRARPSGVEERASLPYAHLRVRAGESASVHAAPLPLAVGFTSAEACDEPLVLSVGKRLSVRGQSPVSVLLGAGSHGYTLRCGGRTLAKGQLAVLADSGLKKLPPRAPRAEVETDGRTYTIHYQNQPPELHVQWPNAPASGPYQLSVDGAVRIERAPSVVLPTGSLEDGAHELVWSAGKRSSRRARVVLQYDRAAPAASVSAPLERSFSAGQRVEVRGEAIRPFQVQLLDGTIERDGQDRFRGVRVTSARAPDIAVRLSHPRRGVHYYVRRSAESP